jgi:ABC-type multidrug transport system fused ATPase/permease subunit
MDDHPEQNVTTLRRLRSFLTRYRARIVLALGLAVCACLLNLPAAIFVQRLLDDLAGGADTVAWYAGGLALVFTLQALVNVANAWMAASASTWSATCAISFTRGSSAPGCRSMIARPPARFSRG